MQRKASLNHHLFLTRQMETNFQLLLKTQDLTVATVLPQRHVHQSPTSSQGTPPTDFSVLCFNLAAFQSSPPGTGAEANCQKQLSVLSQYFLYRLLLSEGTHHFKATREYCEVTVNNMYLILCSLQQNVVNFNSSSIIVICFLFKLPVCSIWFWLVQNLKILQYSLCSGLISVVVISTLTNKATCMRKLFTLPGHIHH